MKIGDVDVNHNGGPAMLADGGAWVPLGSLQSRKTYPLLYAAIGHAYSDEDLRCCNSELFVCGNEIHLPKAPE